MRSRISIRGCVRPSVRRSVTHKLKPYKEAVFDQNHYQYERGRILCRVYGLVFVSISFDPPCPDPLCPLLSPPYRPPFPMLSHYMPCCDIAFFPGNHFSLYNHHSIVTTQLTFGDMALTFVIPDGHFFPRESFRDHLTFCHVVKTYLARVSTDDGRRQRRPNNSGDIQNHHRRKGENK